MHSVNETHDPALSSWVESAGGHADFPIQNLPFAVFRRRGSNEDWRGGVAIGDCILDLRGLVSVAGLAGHAADALAAAARPQLNDFIDRKSVV